MADLDSLVNIDSVKLYQKGDIVLIRAYPVKGISSKVLSYYDTTEFEIVHVSRRAKTYVVQKITEDERIQKQRLRIAHNLVKRIRKKEDIDSPRENDEKTDNESDENEEETDNEEPEQISDDAGLDTDEDQADETDRENVPQNDFDKNRSEDQSTQSRGQPSDVSRNRQVATRYNLRRLK